MKARTLDRANVNKHVRPTIVRLNKAEAFLAVEPLHNTRCHFPSPMLAKQIGAHTTCEQIRSSDVLGEKALQGVAIKAASLKRASCPSAEATFTSMAGTKPVSLCQTAP